VAGLVQGGIRILLLTLSNASGADREQRSQGCGSSRVWRCKGHATHVTSNTSVRPALGYVVEHQDVSLALWGRPWKPAWLPLSGWLPKVGVGPI
jgi:hypothetical protein